MFFKISFSFVYIIYIIITLLLCFQFVKVKTQSISPSYRKLHGATLIGNKLYISGGITEFDDPKNENKSPDDNFFYLDLTNPFDTSKLSWKTVPNNVENFPIELLSSKFTGGMAVGIGGVNNDMIYFINNENDINLSPVLSFNTNSNLWETPKISAGVRPIGQNQMKVIDYNHKLYFLSINGMYIFDTINLNCELMTDSPIFRLGYGATLLPYGIIVYMGGNDNNDLLTNFNQVYLYDINNNKWETKVTTGTIPPSDYGITSVLGLDGNRIIVFGGMINNNLQVLDITNNYTWYVPKVSGKAPVYKRGEHTATVVENYMLITFGSNGNGPDEKFKYRSSGESDVLLLDISDDSEYAWTTTFDITMSEPRYSYSLPQKIGIIVGPIIGAVLLVIILSRCFHVRRQKNNKLITPSDKDIPT